MADDEEETKSKNPIKWRETCFGIWTRRKKQEKGEFPWTCNGIHFISVEKDTPLSSIKPSHCRGIQVVSQQVDEDERSNKKVKRNLSHLEKRIHGTQNMVEERFNHFINNGVSVSELWQGMEFFAKASYDSALRIATHCKPKERIYQAYDFATRKLAYIEERFKKIYNDNYKKK